MRIIKNFLVFSVVAIIFMCGSTAFAAAWTAEKGGGQAIISLSSFDASHYFDDNSNSKKSGNKFTKHEFNPLMEYGFTDSITIGVKPSYRLWKMKGVDNTKPVTSFNECGVVNPVQNNNINGETFEADLFFRKKLLEVGRAIFSVQPLIKTPCLITINSGTSVVWRSYEAEMRALAGYSFLWQPKLLGKQLFEGLYHFLDFEVAYRKRNSPFTDVVKIDATAGLQITEKVMLLGQVFANVSTGKENVGTIEASPNNFVTNVNNYGNMKLQLSGVYKAADTVYLQLGAYTDVVGKNYGDGQGVVLSLWKRF